MPKEGVLETIIEVFSTVTVGKVLGELDKRVSSYVADFIRRIMKRIMLMAAGVAITLVGLTFLFAASALYLNELLRSAWMGWGILGLIILAIGVGLLASSRR